MHCSLLTLQLALRAYFGRAKAACLQQPSPSGPLPLTRPISSYLLEFQHGAFASKNIRALEEDACTVRYYWQQHLNYSRILLQFNLIPLFFSAEAQSKQTFTLQIKQIERKEKKTIEIKQCILKWFAFRNGLGPLVL